MLIGFDDMVADMLNPVVTELFIIGKKLNISLDFIAQYYFVAQKSRRQISTHYFIMKIIYKQQLQ